MTKSKKPKVIHGDSTGATYLTPEQYAKLLGIDVATAAAPVLVISPVPTTGTDHLWPNLAKHRN